MSTEEVTFDAPAPAKKKKPGKKAKPRARANPAKAKVAFPGLTRTACSDDCYANKACSISGSYCAHPTKGGLQARDMSNTAALKRLQNARDQIGVRIDPDRFK